MLDQAPLRRGQVIERRIDRYERNFKNFLSVALVDIELPMARPQFPAVHEFQHDIASVAIGDLGIRQADTDIVFDSAAVIKELECVSWHLPHSLAALLGFRRDYRTFDRRQSARNASQASARPRFDVGEKRDRSEGSGKTRLFFEAERTKLRKRFVDADNVSAVPRLVLC